MNDAELIARQAKRLEENADLIEDLNSRLDRIRLVCTCIGGPLNDNRLGYTREQMVYFFKIIEIAGDDRTADRGD